MPVSLCVTVLCALAHVCVCVCECLTWMPLHTGRTMSFSFFSSVFPCVCMCVCVLVHVITPKAPGEMPMSQVTPSTPRLCSFFPSSLNTGLEVLNLEEITSTGQLRREITRESVIEGQHLGAASHINETSQREGGRESGGGGGDLLSYFY